MAWKAIILNSIIINSLASDTRGRGRNTLSCEMICEIPSQLSIVGTEAVLPRDVYLIASPQSKHYLW